MAPSLGRLRPRRAPRDRQGARRLPRGARLPGGADVSDSTARLDRLRGVAAPAAARHEPRQHPLPDRVRHVERGAARRSERAGRSSSRTSATSRPPRQLPGVEAVLTKRSLMLDLAKRLRGKIAFEADILPFSQVEVLGSGGLELVPVTGMVEALRAVKDEDEIAMIARAARAADRAFEALTAETWIGRSERELAWRLRQLLHAHGVDHLAFDTAIATGLNGSKPHGEPDDDIIETADARHRRLGRAARRLLLRLHAHRRDRRAPRGAARDLRRLPRGAARGGRRDQARDDRRRGRRDRAQGDRRRRLRRQLRPRPRPRRRDVHPRGAAALARSRATRSRSAT